MAKKYQGKEFYNYAEVPADIRLVSHDYYKRLSKTYGATEGGFFFVLTPSKARLNYLWAPAMLAEKPQFGQEYLATEAEGTGLDQQYEAYEGGVIWSQEQQYLQDVFQVSEANDPGQVYGPPNWLDGRTFTADQVPKNVTFLSHKDYNETLAAVSQAVFHRGKFLLQCFVNSFNKDVGFLVPCAYFVTASGGKDVIFATEKPDDPNEQGRYFFNRERFADNIAGELAFQAWTATQGDFWGWEMGILAYKVGEVATEAATDVAAAAAAAASAAANGLENMILHDPLVVVLGVVVIGVVAYAATR